MTVLVVGASGATGRLLVEHLLNRGEYVRAIIRSPERLPDSLRNHERLSVISASLLDLSDEEIAQHVDGCDAVASCLGHNLSLRGIYGHPRRLVTDAARRLCNAIIANNSEKPTKYVLMNTAGNSNRDLNEPVSKGQKMIIGLLRLILPPHVDNEQASDYLRVQIGQDYESVEWAVVRPDTLIDEENFTEYLVHPSPVRSAIFDPGKTSRINVAHFMADLIKSDEISLRITDRGRLTSWHFALGPYNLHRTPFESLQKGIEVINRNQAGHILPFISRRCCIGLFDSQYTCTRKVEFQPEIAVNNRVTEFQRVPVKTTHTVDITDPYETSIEVLLGTHIRLILSNFREIPASCLHNRRLEAYSPNVQHWFQHNLVFPD